jgi:hypothetical protein
MACHLSHQILQFGYSLKCLSCFHIFTTCLSRLRFHILHDLFCSALSLYIHVCLKLCFRRQCSTDFCSLNTLTISHRNCRRYTNLCRHMFALITPLRWTFHLRTMFSKFSTPFILSCSRIFLTRTQLCFIDIKQQIISHNFIHTLPGNIQCSTCFGFYSWNHHQTQASEVQVYAA